MNITLQSLRELEYIMDDVQEMETGLHDYLISGNKGFLDAYYLTVRNLEQDIARIKALYPLYPERKAVFVQLLELVSRKKALAAARISQVEKQGTGIVLQSGPGRGLMDSIRGIVLKFETEDRIVLNQSNTDRQAAARRAARLFIGLGFIFIAGLFIVFWRMWRALKQREQYEQKIAYLAGLIEKTHDAIFSTDSNLIIKSWNNGAREMYGYTTEEALGSPVKSLLKIIIPANEAGKSKSDLDRLGYYKGEYEAFKKSGERVFIQASISVLRNERNEAEGYVAVHRDISEKKKTEQLLKTYNEKLSLQVEEKTVLTDKILERISDGFYSLDDQWNFTYMNKTASMMMGCDPQEIVGKNLWKEFPAAVNLSIYQAYLKAFEEQQYYQVEFNYPPFEKWFMVDIYPSHSGLSTFFRDVTERKKAEEELRHSNERFEMISRTTNDAVWEWDLVTGVMWANETHQQLYGLTLNDPVPPEHVWQQRIHPEDRERLIGKQANALAGDTNVFITEYRFNTEKDGYRNVYDRCYIVRNGEGKAIRILGSIMDITELKKAEEKLKRREAQLAASIENTPNVAVQWYNSKGRVMYWNHASELIFGWSSVEAMGKTLDELIQTPEESALFLKLLEEIATTGKTIGPSEFHFCRKNRTEGYCMATIFSIPSVEGEPYFVCMDVDITESKKFAEALQESEEKYRSIIDQASEGIFMLDEEGDVLEVNHAGALLTGYMRDQLLGKNTKALCEDGELSIVKIKQEELKAGLPVMMERRIRTGDGLVRVVEVSCKMLSNGDILAVMRDITERKKVEQALITSEETRRLIMNSALDAIVGMDTAGLITIWTPQAERIFGWKEDEVIGQRMSVIIIPERYRRAHEEGLARYLQSGKGPVLNKLIELIALHRDGTEFPVELSILPVKQGAHEFFCAFIRDITERKKIEQVVKDSEEKYRTLVEQAMDAIALYDAGGRILDVNTGSVNLLGYSKEELMQLSLQDILTPEEMTARPVQYDVLQQGDSTVKHRKMRRKDQVVIDTEVRSQQLPDGRFLSVIRDLTDRIKAEKELAASYDAIRKLSGHIQDIREEERTNMAREIHDELGQQLTVLKMDVSWLKKRMIASEEPVKQKLNDLIVMLDETVKTVRRISSELRPSLLDDLGLVAAMEWQLGEFEKRSEIVTHFVHPQKELVLPDTIKTALFRILQESLTNVARHSGATSVNVTIELRDNTLSVCINDNGKGFDKDKIAEKRTLGILGMRERIAMIGGVYEIKSQPSEGTEVKVQLSLINYKPPTV